MCTKLFFAALSPRARTHHTKAAAVGWQTMKAALLECSIFNVLEMRAVAGVLVRCVAGGMWCFLVVEPLQVFLCKSISSFLGFRSCSCRPDSFRFKGIKSRLPHFVRMNGGSVSSVV